MVNLMAGCTSASPTWRAKASALAGDLTRKGAPQYFPQEFRSFQDAFEHGEAIFHVHDDDKAADEHYLFAIQKGELIVASLQRLHEQKREEERRRAAELSAQAEEERLMREAAEAELRLREQERRRISEESARIATPQQKAPREHHPVQLPSTYTVRRGETLPQIAGRAEIYNNSSLWPLIYRANRDQIRDPKRLWPGQVLSIPRN